MQANENGEDAQVNSGDANAEGKASAIWNYCQVDIWTDFSHELISHYYAHAMVDIVSFSTRHHQHYQ